jgi:hypothetical protein
MKMKLITLLAFTGLAFASCNSDKNSDQQMDSLASDTSTMADPMMDNSTTDTSGTMNNTGGGLTDTSSTDTVRPNQ